MYLITKIQSIPSEANLDSSLILAAIYLVLWKCMLEVWYFRQSILKQAALHFGAFGFDLDYLLRI